MTPVDLPGDGDPAVPEDLHGGPGMGVEHGEQ